MAGARTLTSSAAEREFDRRARESGEVEVINVSPFTWRHEMATHPGSSPRYIKLEPGERTLIARGYTQESPGAGRLAVPPALDAMSAREAWPGKRAPDKDGKLQWLIAPGPSLPSVVSLDRADKMSARWKEALATKANLDKAPLRLNLTRHDGTEVGVDAVIEETSAPARARAASPAISTAGGVEDAITPIPDDDPDMQDDIPTLPAASATPPAPTQQAAKKNGK